MRPLYLIRFATALTALFAGICTAQAVPARPQPIQVTQSDGTQLTIRLIGDEHRHYILSSDGYSLAQGSDGDLYYAELSATGQLAPTAVKARPVNKLTSAERKIVSTLPKGLKPATMKRTNSFGRSKSLPVPRTDGKLTPPEGITDAHTIGKLKSLIILVDYTDKSYKSGTPQQDFQNMLMQDGYSANGATGSAWNYYQDNSGKLFDPNFVVVGPYHATHNSKYYAQEDDDGYDNTPELIVEACRLADKDVDFTEFADNGVIRDIFVFYAGTNQAETGDATTIWPHRWDVRGDSRYSSVFLDGVQLQGYACSSELNGSRTMAGIGTFCHEFGHVLGWPDFYDTDYEGSGGEAAALESFSLMCSGSYNNNGRTPPAVNILERWMVGWAEPEEITASGAYTLDPVWNNKGYLVRTSTDNDYFLFETRATGSFKWDNYIANNYGSIEGGKGMLVYHVDYTTSYARKWITTNDLNADPSHECMKIVRSVPSSSGHPLKTYFPGSNNVTSLSSSSNAHYISWKKQEPNVTFSNISLQGEQIILTAKGDSNLKIEAEANQYDALLTWNGDASAKWEVSWKIGGGTEQLGSKTVTGNACHISGLLPATSYTATITNISSAGGESQVSAFTTAEKSAYKGVHIKIPATGYSANVPFALSVLDYPDEIGKTDWFIDGKAANDTYVKLAAGSHRIMAVITDAADDSKQYIIKYITVK